MLDVRQKLLARTSYKSLYRAFLVVFLVSFGILLALPQNPNEPATYLDDVELMISRIATVLILLSGAAMFYYWGRFRENKDLLGEDKQLEE